ncbi:MAG: hypothetical protein GY801_09660 [bacterium]|nr:hypothetical protein [bacterium]
MRKFTKGLMIAAIGLLLLPAAALAEEITLCYKGESISMSEENAARFFELGAKRGECPENSEGESGNGKEGKEEGRGSGKEQKQAKEHDRDSDQEREQKQAKEHDRGSDSEREQKQAKEHDRDSDSEKEQKQQKQQKQSSGKSKVTVCHKGKHTITISEAALKAHQAHGDSIGSCAENNSSQGQQEIGQNGQQSQQPTSGGDSEKDRTSGTEAEKKQKNGYKGGRGQGKKEDKSK